MIEKPAPWDLEGSGFLILLRRSAVIYGQPPESRGWVSFLMCVNYETSPVGPYLEWLWIPGKAPDASGIMYTISDILVDTRESVENGRRNWGIPKRLGRLDWQCLDGRMEMRSEVDEFTGRAAVRSIGPAFPFTTKLFPLGFHQHLNGHTYRLRPSASGRVRFAKVQELELDGFGALRSVPRNAVLGALSVERFAMCFPVPEIS